jgi:threonyl-tRNA synthetase
MSCRPDAFGPGSRSTARWGARIRQSRRRRDALVAVIGAAEAAQDAVHVTDVAADVAQTVPLAEFFVRLDEARAQRLATIRW